MFVYHVYESLIGPRLYRTALNIYVIYEDIGSVDFVTRDFKLIFIRSEIAGCSFITYMRAFENYGLLQLFSALLLRD